jgi:hypothetical protein
MASAPADHEIPVAEPGSIHPSDESTANTPSAFPQHRHGYLRMDSQVFEVPVEDSDPAPQYLSPVPSNINPVGREGQGLGITQKSIKALTTTLEGQHSLFFRMSPNPKSSPSSLPSSPYTPGSSRPLLSPDFTRPISSRNKYGGECWGPLQEEPEDLQDSLHAEDTFEDGLSIALGGPERQSWRLGNDNDNIR